MDDDLSGCWWCWLTCGRGEWRRVVQRRRYEGRGEQRGGRGSGRAVQVQRCSERWGGEGRRCVMMTHVWRNAEDRRWAMLVTSGKSHENLQYGAFRSMWDICWDGKVWVFFNSRMGHTWVPQTMKTWDGKFERRSVSWERGEWGIEQQGHQGRESKWKNQWMGMTQWQGAGIGS